MAALDLEDKDVKTVFYKLILHVFSVLIDDKRFRDVITQSSSEAVYKDENVHRIATNMSTTIFDSPSVITFMV